MAKRKLKTDLETTSNEQQNKELIDNKESKENKELIENKETTENKENKENKTNDKTKEVVIKKSIGEGVYIRKLRRI